MRPRLPSGTILVVLTLLLWSLPVSAGPGFKIKIQANTGLALPLVEKTQDGLTWTLFEKISESIRVLIKE